MPVSPSQPSETSATVRNVPLLLTGVGLPEVHVQPPILGNNSRYRNHEIVAAQSTIEHENRLIGEGVGILPANNMKP